MASDITVSKANTLSRTITITENGSAKDITGYTLFFTAKCALQTSDVLSAVSADIVDHSDPTNGVTSLTLTKDQTDINPDEDYVYDFKLVASGGTSEVITIPGGKFIVDDTVTRRDS